MRASLGLLAALLASPALAADIPGTEFTSGNWYGSGETGSDGRFLDCYISVGYVNGEQLWVGLYGDDSLTVFLSQPGTGFTPGKTYPASLMTEMGIRGFSLFNIGITISQNSKHAVTSASMSKNCAAFLSRP